jgi:hypothetical protein
MPLIPLPTATTGEDPDRHALERLVHRRLHDEPGLRVWSLTVHQCPQGLCLEGHIEVCRSDIDWRDVLRVLESETPIINRLLITGL